MSLYDETEYATGEDVQAVGYVPTLEAVRASYATDYFMTDVSGLQRAEDRAAAFDRFVAEHLTRNNRA